MKSAAASGFDDLIRASEAASTVCLDTAPVAGLTRSLAPTAALLLTSAALGWLLCVMKGEGSGLPDAIGNLSAPYVIVSVAAGLTTRRWWAAALLGVTAAEVTVGGFYGAWVVHFGHELSPTAVSLWGGAGVLSGMFFGVIGWAARTRRGLRYVIPSLLILEPVLTEGAAPLLGRFGLGYGWGVVGLSNLLAYGIEIAVGIVVFLLVRQHLRSRRRQGNGVPSV